MKRMGLILILAGVVQLSAVTVHAQIRGLTVRAPRNPVPPMPLLQPSAPTAASAAVSAAIPAAPTKPPIPPPALQGHAFDKDEVDRRVLEFQQKRAREGSAAARFDLAIRYLKGNGVRQDAGQARYWLRLAAQGGSSEARKKLQELEPESK